MEIPMINANKNMKNQECSTHLNKTPTHVIGTKIQCVLQNENL